jgi:peptidoglycan/LPS O-acetylase OafA/YrhL
MKSLELPALTGIRFYAALLVFLSHVPIVPGMDTMAHGHLIFDAGVVGVSFFFVLSGFILTYNYAGVFRAGVTASDYTRFVWDRFTKIYPVHLLALLFVLPIAVFSPNLPLDWRAVPFHLLLAQCFWPFATPPFYDYLNVPSWSISCEWFFYLLAPVAMFCVLSGSRRWWPVLLVAAYAACGWYLWSGEPDATRLYVVSWFAPSRFAEFLTGIFLGRMFVTRPVPHTVPWLSGLLQAIGLLLILAGAVYRAQAPWPFWGGLLYVPGSTLLVLGLAYGRGFWARHLGSRPLRLLGTASFSFYLMHAPFLRAVKGLCLQFGWEVQSWPMFAVVAVGLLAFTQATALVVCHTYELPVQARLRQWFRAPAVHPTGRPIPLGGGGIVG